MDGGSAVPGHGAVVMGLPVLCLHVQRLHGEGLDDVQGHGHVDSRGLVFHVLSLLGVELVTYQSWVDSSWDGLGNVEGVHHVLGLQGEGGDDVLIQSC